MLDITPSTAVHSTAPVIYNSKALPGKITTNYPSQQHSIANAVSCHGVGLHSGKAVTMRLLPAPADHGIVFVRTDLTTDNIIPARWDAVNFTTLCSQIANPSGIAVSTIEHLMAACAAMAIDNLRIEIDGPEVPIMDGSAAPFLFLLDCAGLAAQNAPRQYIEILKPIAVFEKNGIGTKQATLLPGQPFHIRSTIEFADPIIGRQEYHFTLSPTGFKNQIARARTFGFMAEVEQMRAQGFGLGGNLENSVVVGTNGVINPGGLRFANEFVRHKILDCVGDLYLAGYPILGTVETYRSGHGLHNQLLRSLFADPTAWRLCSAEFANTADSANDPQPLRLPA